MTRTGSADGVEREARNELNTTPSRMVVARIVDPEAWNRKIGYAFADSAGVLASLRKADTILSALGLGDESSVADASREGSQVVATPSLAECVAAVDAAESACPVRNPAGRHVPECPKCGALPSQNCGPSVTAHYNAVQALRAALSEPREAEGEPPPSPWRSMAEAPMDGTRFLAFCGSAYTPTAFETWWANDSYGEGWHVYSDPEEKYAGGVTVWFPTAWMPMPLPNHPAGEPETGAAEGGE